MKKSYKKLVLAAPLVGMIGTGILAPVTSFAAETTSSSTVSQVNSIKGYLIKDDLKTAISQTNEKISKLNQSGPASPGFPTLPADPLAPVPNEGTSVVEMGNMGDILYFEGKWTADEKLIDGKSGKIYLRKCKDGNIEIGAYNPDTYELYPVALPPETQTALQSVLQPIYGKAFDGQTKVKRETKYELIGSSITDNVSTYNFSQSIKHGVTNTDLFSFASTLGWKMSAKIGGGLIPAEITAEMSGSLTATYGHQISVSNETTRTQTFSVGPVNNSSYKYNKYATAAYQLHSTYTVIPGAGLQEVIEKSDFFGMKLKGLANKTYKYSEDQVYFGVTPDSHMLP
ncbi:hypothetical protein [Bacillus wiedmannii]|uniref:hypothetical protein n=1 Tax=Bacillus wiedmannii TaxID=1890302 RepID=UPI000CD8E221|nr:hypothetical protein [Bacillus wiedmannii]MBG9832076.1 hypothetical protein [Bacillus wiedmannii]UOB98718.1 hypothetical protein BTI679_61190 [Bacillus wiedmannii]